MSVSSESTTQLVSPFRKIPYEILQEIFVHSLPQYPPERLILTVEPILLCHVCSSWRTVALTSPNLWTHLAYIFKAKWFQLKDGSFCWTIHRKDAEFIRWWRKNHGAKSPSLNFWTDADISGVDDLLQADMDIEESDDMKESLADLASVINYMSTAQFLDVGLAFRNVIYHALESGALSGFHNLHTLAIDWNGMQDDEHPYLNMHIVGLLPDFSPGLLRRFEICNAELKTGTFILGHLSELTHISLSYVRFSLEFWHRFIRNFPCLQLGSFDIYHVGSNGLIYSPPAKFTLAHLHTLFFCYICETVPCPDSIVPYFENLSLPFVHTLALTSDLKSWRDCRAITQISTILKLAPNVTTFSLGQYQMDYHCNNDVRPIWRDVAHMIHLKLDVGICGQFSLRAELTLAQFIRDTFDTNAKLFSLNDAACPIRKITLNYCQMEMVSDCSASLIRDLNKRWPNINFQLNERLFRNPHVQQT